MPFHLGNQGIEIAGFGRPVDAGLQRHVGKGRVSDLEIERHGHRRHDQHRRHGDRQGQAAAMRSAALLRRRDQAPRNLVARGFGLLLADQTARQVALELGQLVAKHGAVIGTAVGGIAIPLAPQHRPQEQGQNQKRQRCAENAIS